MTTRSEAIDDTIKIALQWQHRRGHHVQPKVGRMIEGVYTVDGRGHPDDQHDDEEQDRDVGVCLRAAHRVGVDLANAEELRWSHRAAAGSCY